VVPKGEAIGSAPLARAVSGRRLHPTGRVAVILDAQTCPSRAGSQKRRSWWGKKRVRWRATPPAAPEAGIAKAGGAAPDRTDSCTSRSSSRCAAIAAAPATERSSRKTAPPQPFVSDPDRPLAPSEGSNTWIERPRPRRVRRRLRTASPRSSSGRPTRRVSRPPRPPSAHRRSRASRERLASRGSAESGPRMSERRIGRRRAARRGAGRPPPRRRPRSGGPDRPRRTTARPRPPARTTLRLRGVAAAVVAAEADAAAVGAEPPPETTRRSRPQKRVRPGPGASPTRQPRTDGHAARARAEGEAGAPPRRSPSRAPRASATTRSPMGRASPPRAARRRTEPTRPSAAAAAVGAAGSAPDPPREPKRPRDRSGPRGRNRSGRSDRSGPVDRRRSRSRWHPGDRPVACGLARSEDGAVAGSGSPRSCRRGSPTSSW
jgi:hypothetical protein